jgi:regulation of enolase protein 1 (concanavalin A-like superfamily)
MFESASWLNRPAQFEVSEDKLTIWTNEKTDFWRETHYGFIRDSGHAYGVDVSGDFTAQVRVNGCFEAQYDQAGILVRADAQNWVKAGVELSDGVLTISSVLTVGSSDWAVGASLPTGEFWIRATVKSRVLLLQYSEDGNRWSLIRLAPFPFDGPLFVGPMCCSPQRAKLIVEFDRFEVLQPPVGLLHDPG